MDTTDADSLVLQTKLQYLKYTQARPFTKPNVWFYHRRLGQTTTNYKLQGEGWATRALFV